ncbi:hypothetical protein [Parafrankia elaeagni]|uniref:hypothetical protein n=1 Tax=Parafrankia elaeagni TaxID=222534 RepID=UPI0003A814CA|nr:hypothetical protein [Parafrankia elaeagni]
MAGRDQVPIFPPRFRRITTVAGDGDERTLRIGGMYSWKLTRSPVDVGLRIAGLPVS